MYWLVVNWTIKSKLQWNFNRNSNIFLEENMFENDYCKIVVILFQHQCLKRHMPNTGFVNSIWIGLYVLVKSMTTISHANTLLALCVESTVHCLGKYAVEQTVPSMISALMAHILCHCNELKGTLLKEQAPLMLSCLWYDTLPIKLADTNAYNAWKSGSR